MVIAENATAHWQLVVHYSAHWVKLVKIELLRKHLEIVLLSMSSVEEHWKGKQWSVLQGEVSATDFCG